MHFPIFFTSLLILHLGSCDEEVKCPKIITKSQWGGRAATSVNNLIIPIPYVVIHHTVTPKCETRSSCSERVENIQSFQMDSLGWHDIGYAFLVGGDGNVYEGCGWMYEGAHTYGYNKRSVGIGFIGNFQNEAASQRMIDAAYQLIQCGKSQGILRDDVRVIAARQVTSTQSPGAELFVQIQDWPEWAPSP